MKHTTSLFLPVASVLLALAACAPSIDAAARADLDRRLAATPPSDREIAAPAAPAPVPLAVGQWITLKQVDKEGRPSLATYAIVAAEADAFWLEVQNDSYFGKTASRMLVAFGDRRDASAFDVRAIYTKEADGDVQQVPPPVLSIMMRQFTPILETLQIRWDGLPQEDTRVLAGRFASCFKGRQTVAIAGMSATSDVWWHPEVPINGLVKTVGVGDGTTTELVAYGSTGAASVF